MPASAPRSRLGSAFGSGLGFMLVAGGFAIGLGLTFRHADPELVPPAETAPAIEPVKIYLPFGDQLFLPAADGKVAVAGLTLAIEGPPEVLLALQAEVEARLPDLRAQVLDTAQATAETLPQGASLRDTLPERIRAVLNAAVGTEPLPAPVTEVLLTEYMEQ